MLYSSEEALKSSFKRSQLFQSLYETWPTRQALGGSQNEYKIKIAVWPQIPAVSLIVATIIHYLLPVREKVGGEGGRKNIWFSGRTERISVVANKVKEEGGGGGNYSKLTAN